MSADIDSHAAPELPDRENWPTHWPSFETFLAYFGGELLPEEEAQVRALLASDARARAFAMDLAEDLVPLASDDAALAFEAQSAPRKVARSESAQQRPWRIQVLRFARTRYVIAAAALLLLGGGALLFFAQRARPTHLVSEGFALATQLSVIGDLGATRRGPSAARREAVVANAGSELVLSAAVPEDAYAWFALIKRESAQVETLAEVELHVAEQRVALTRFDVPTPVPGNTLWLLSMVATAPLGRTEEARVAGFVREAPDAESCARDLRRSFGCVVALRPLEILVAKGAGKIGARVPRKELRRSVADIEKALRQDQAYAAAELAAKLLERCGYTRQVSAQELLSEARWEIAELARLRRAALAWERADPTLRKNAERAEEARAAVAREFPLLVARGERDPAQIEALRAVCRSAESALAAICGDELAWRWSPVHLEGQLLLQLANDAPQALSRLENARAGLAAAGAVGHPRYASVLNDLSGACRALGEQDRARQFAAAALRIYEEAEIGGRVLFEVLRSLADLHRAAGEEELADEHARAAESVLTAAEDEGGRETALLHLHLTRASIAESAGKHAEADRELRAAEELAQRSGDERRLDTLRARRADFLLLRGDASSAVTLLEELRARDVARFGTQHVYVALDDFALGRGFARLGRQDEALVRWERAFLHFEERLADESDVRARLDVAAHAEIETIAAAWSDLLIARGEIARAFEVRERARSRSLLALFAPAELDAEQRKNLRELQARKSVLHVEIETLQYTGEASPEFQHELAARQHALADLLQEEWLMDRSAAQTLRNAQPAFEPANASELRRALGNGVALWYFAWSPERADLLWLPPDENDAALELRAAPLAQDANEVAHLAALVAQAQTALREPAILRAELEEALRALGSRLVPNAALERCAQASAIALVLDGPLRELPLEALIVSGDPGAPSFLLDVAPPLSRIRSLATLRALRSSDVRRDARAEWNSALLVGAPALQLSDQSAVEQQAFVRSASGASESEPDLLPSPRLAVIPETSAELHLVAAILGAKGFRVETLKGTDAMVSRAAERASSKHIVHLASHGRRAEAWRPRTSGIMLASETSAPQQPGLLDLDAVLRSWPRGATANALVILSACESGVGGKSSSAVELTLPAAFHRLGVPSVIASLWSIDSASTVTLIAALYAALAEEDLPTTAIALQRAQRVIRATASDPRAWAAWAHFGVPSEHGTPRNK